MDLPTLLSAGASTVAAMLAGLNLLVSGRRELVRLCLDGADLPDQDAIADVRERLRRARAVMIGAARRSMHLRGESDPDGRSGLPVRALCPDPVGFGPDVDV